jgi:radical SAM superfamily enzyme YgiQ (UPF0313 family)
MPRTPQQLASIASSAVDGDRVGTRRDVVFVDLPCTTYELGRRFKSAWSFKQVLQPHELHLGFRYMVAALTEAGLQAEIVFPSADHPRSRSELVEDVVRLRPRLVGLTTYEGSLEETLDFAAQVKAAMAGVVICLGGHLATFSWAEVLRDFPTLVDLVVLGEGEQTIVEVAGALRAAPSGTRPTGVAGTAWSDAGRPVLGPPRPPLADLDVLPFPVVLSGSLPDEEAPLFVATSRGCYARCTFCRSSLLTERWRPRRPSAVVDELERAHANGVRTFELVDDNFLGPGRRGRKRASAIAGEILRRGLDLRFHASCRVNDVDEDTMRLLQRAGLFSVSVGVESGVPRQLETYNKRVTVRQSEQKLRLLDRLGIPTLAYVIFFDPYMTLDEVTTNVAFLRRVATLDHVRFEEIIFRRLIPISGTPLFDRIRDDGLLTGNYLTGHAFTFEDERVGQLSEFMETVDLRIERAFQEPEYRRVPGLYTAMKERVELDLADRCVEAIRRESEGGAAALGAALEASWRGVLTKTFDPAGAAR